MNTSLFFRVKNKLRRMSSSYKQSVPNSVVDKRQEETVKRWFKDKGDKTMRLNYPLNEGSLVIDVGGYKGEWANEIFKKYRSNIIIFELHRPFHEQIRKRFAGNNKIRPFPVGLGSQTEQVNFSVAENSSSVFVNNETLNENKKELVQLQSVKEFLQEQHISHVDLIKINIEGGEYDLLEAIIQNNLTACFQNIQVQFHDFFPDARSRMNQIQQALQQTHELTYQYEFVWENWRLKA